jgi:hypothetical protein
MNRHAQAILRSARIAELKIAGSLEKPRPPVEPPLDWQQRAGRSLLAAELLRIADEVDQLK